MPSAVVPQADEAPVEKEGAYHAVVYFHGIGEQRRYAEIGRLIDALDLYAQDGREPGDETGVLRGIVGQFDTGRGSEDASDVGYAELWHVGPAMPSAAAGVPRVRKRFRVYEAYWAPETAGGVPASEALRWVARNLLRPMRIVVTRWRTHGRLRKTFLHGLRPVLGDDTWQVLSKASWDFEGLEARRTYPSGSFSQFVSFLRQRDAPDDAVAGARMWRRRVMARAFAYQMVLVTLLIAALLGVLAVAAAVLWLLNAVSGKAWLVGALGDGAEASWSNAVAIAGIAVMQVGLQRFLSRSLGDVVFWASYGETDMRHRVRNEMLAVGTRTLRQVLEDQRCKRVVVVAHSLGTTVAYEALLKLGAYNRARNRESPGGGPLPIAKLDQFITLGSPIDKLHFFVESHEGGGHRYNRLYESLHGDVGTVPFSANRNPRVHWINLWSAADIISGRLESPMSMERTGVRPVNNVELAMTRFPDPMMSHSGYFSHRPAVKVLFDAIVRGRFSYVNPARDKRVFDGQEHEVPNYDKSDVAGISHDAMARPVQVWICGVVWLTAIYWVADWLSLSGLAMPVGWTALGSAIVMLVLAIVGRAQGLRDRLSQLSKSPPNP